MAVISVSTSRAYRAIWRWHFYAGLIVAPFLLILSVTGAIYLFNDEINDAVYPEQRFVTPQAVAVPPSRLIRAALDVYPGTPTRVDLPPTSDRSAIVFVTPRQGAPVRVGVDPGTGRVLGSTVYSHTLVGFADEMHGSLTLGTAGDRIVELAACWALVLIVTGLYLWWPRGGRGLAGIVYPRLRAGGRRFWRDVHAVTGVWTVGLIAFLLVTGLPWAGIEGDLLKRATAALGIGYPQSSRNYDPPASVPMKTALGEAPWTMEQAPMPRSASRARAKSSADHVGHVGHGAAMAGPDAAPLQAAALERVDRIAVTLARDHGLVRGYRLFLPVGVTGVYTAYTYPDRPQGQRTLYFDRWSGALIREVAYADYGWAAKAIELGVQLHMGNYFGLANQIVMLATCIAIVVLVVSGVTMWWKRRPVGRLGAPPKVPNARIYGAVALLLVAAVLMPLMGASLVIVCLIDRFAGAGSGKAAARI